jgi:predicted Zn-dependent protease with MMP-like domain
MDLATFEQLVVDVLDSLPPQFANHLQNIEVIIEPYLDEAIRERLELDDDEIVYGFYEGVPLTERSVYDDICLPDTILIFWEPLVADFPNPSQLREEVRRTVLHELAHHMGISDERLDELGVY